MNTKSHYGVVNLPSINATYGENMRKIIKAREGWSLIGVDQPSAHPRILSFLTQNEMFLKALNVGVEEDLDGNYVGEDFHTMNSILFGLNTKEDRDLAVKTQDKDLIHKLSNGRKRSKGGTYACIYGGSGKTVAKSIGVDPSEGETRKKSFLSGLGLDTLLVDLEHQFKTNKVGGGSYIDVCGPYYIQCESKHKLINTLAIGSEAVLQKMAIILFNRWLKEQKLQQHVRLIANFHDELLVECEDEYIDVAKEYLANVYEYAALAIDIDNDFRSVAKVGPTYAEVH